MTKEEYDEKIVPLLDTLNAEEAKVIWYIEAIKRGNPCITDDQKKKALNMCLVDQPKIKLHDWSKNENKYY